MNELIKLKSMIWIKEQEASGTILISLIAIQLFLFFSSNSYNGLMSTGCI